MNAYERMRNAYRHRDALAREWRQSGGKVVGYVCDNVPAELFRAAGLLPYRLSGDTGKTRTEIRSILGEVHTTRMVGLEFIDAISAKLVAGETDFLDYLVTPHNRKPVQAIGMILKSTEMNKPHIRVPEFYYLDRTYVRSFLTSGFNRKWLMDLVSAVEGWAGKAITEEALKQAISDASETRRLMRELNALRQGGSPRVTGVEALEIYGASHFMEPADFQAALSEFLTEAKARTPLPGARVYVGGSPLDHTSFYEIVESSGAVVVAEDHCWGARCAELDVSDGQDPFEALARRYVAAPACSLLGSIDDTTAAVVRRALASGAQGAIFNVINGDGMQMWETPSEIDALREKGMPCLHLKRQPYRIEDPAPVRSEIETFVSSLEGKKIHAGETQSLGEDQ